MGNEKPNKSHKKKRRKCHQQTRSTKDIILVIEEKIKEMLHLDIYKGKIEKHDHNT